MPVLRAKGAGRRVNRQEALETLVKFDEHLKNRIADEQRGGNPVHEATARRVLEALRFMQAENAELHEVVRAWERVAGVLGICAPPIGPEKPGAGT